MSTVLIDALSNPAVPFTPGLTFGGGSTGMGFSASSGRYTKIGNLIVFRIDFTLSAKGSSTGTALVTGLPFTADVYSGASIGYANAMASITGQIFALVEGSSTNIDLLMMVSSSMAALTHANFTNTTRLIIAGAYTT